MREKLVSVAVAVAIASFAGSACAMTAGERPRACRVVGGEKLPADSGGADALCNAILEAATKLAPGVGYDVEITVLPMDRLSAKVTMADGRKLPEQGFAQMDKPLSRSSFERFASAIAGEMARDGGTKS